MGISLNFSKYIFSIKLSAPWTDLLFIFYFSEWLPLFLWYGQYDSSVINFWPMEVNLKDFIYGANMISSNNRVWVDDRFGTSFSSIRVTDSSNYYTLPPGIYFNGDFTVTVWVKSYSTRIWGRIIDFGNGGGIDNVLFTINANPINYPTFYIQHTDGHMGLASGKIMAENQWYFLAFTLQGTIAKIYLNGIETSSHSSFKVPQAIVRNYNFIGDSNYRNEHPNADFDEIKIHNRALSQQELLNTMRLKYPYMVEV